MEQPRPSTPYRQAQPYTQPYAQPYAHTQPYPPPRGTNGFAVAAFVLSILGGLLLAVVFAFVALSQVRDRGQAGKGLAVAALCISGAVAGAGTVRVESLRTGDCFDAEWLTSQTTTNVFSVDAVPCTTSHRAEVYGSFELVDGAHPGEDAVVADADAGCLQRFETFVGSTYDASALEMTYLFPSEDAWALGDRAVTCVAWDPTAPTTGSFAGTGR